MENKLSLIRRIFKPIEETKNEPNGYLVGLSDVVKRMSELEHPHDVASYWLPFCLIPPTTSSSLIIFKKNFHVPT